MYKNNAAIQLDFHSNKDAIKINSDIFFSLAFTTKEVIKFR